jgi:hypothetical protein
VQAASRPRKGIIPPAQHPWSSIDLFFAYSGHRAIQGGMMSRNLPDNPNLDFLRKQAKSLLEDLRARNPEAKLADALHLVAKEHGFATWPQLKEHVDSLVSPLAGTWLTDSHTLIISVDRGHVAIEVHTDDGTGDKLRSRHVVRTAGGRQPVEGSAGFFSEGRWSDVRTFQTLAFQGEEEMARVVYSVSPDSKSMTVDMSAEPHNGYSPGVQSLEFRRAG